MSIIERLKSPVVLIQILSILATAVIYFAPEATETIKVIATSITAIISIISGLNNPTDSNSF